MLEGSQFTFVSTGKYSYQNGPVLETPNTRVSNGTPVFEIRHYCPKLEASAHIQTPVSKIRHWCPKFNSSIQNQTLLSKSGL